MILILSVLILFVLYAAVIGFYNRGWRQIPLEQKSPVGAGVSFSVIIPARNEEENIGRLLLSLRRQQYPSFEVIVVDDHSTDATAAMVKTFPEVQLISLQSGAINSYKKKAIETGIAAAQHEWIVCTDADCVVPPQWLGGFASLIEKEAPVFVAAPVRLTAAASSGGREKWLFIFQALDFLTLQGITGASVYKNFHSMCNGANLAYRKNVFEEVGGFRGIDHIASGDDMLLMHKIWKKYPDRVRYLKSSEAIVDTAAAPTWSAFFNQRIRWASKATGYDDKRITAVLLLVYLFNLSFLVLLVGSIFSLQCFYALLLFWIAKTLVEYPFVKTVSVFFGLQPLMRYFFFSQPLHIVYTILSGFLGVFGKYEWKGRNVR